MILWSGLLKMRMLEENHSFENIGDEEASTTTGGGATATSGGSSAGQQRIDFIGEARGSRQEQPARGSSGGPAGSQSAVLRELLDSEAISQAKNNITISQDALLNIKKDLESLAKLRDRRQAEMILLQLLQEAGK